VGVAVDVLPTAVREPAAIAAAAVGRHRSRMRGKRPAWP
jgi:hypothetical protein